MPLFRYIAREANGKRVRGEFEAVNPAEAERWLREWGLEPLELVPHDVGDQPAAGAALTRGDSEEVLAQVAELSTNQLPLPAGLRAAASEAHRGRVAHALRAVARDLERGQTLEAALHQRARQLPPHVHGLILAAARTRRLGPALDELIAHQQLNRETAWSILAAISYPILVLTGCVAVLSFLPIFVVPHFKRMFEEFALKLPVATELLIRVSDALHWLLAYVAVWLVPMVILLIVVLWWGVPGAWLSARIRRVLHAMPLLGPLWQWSAAANFSRILAMLVEQGLPLSEALRLTGRSVSDAAIREACREMSSAVEEGQSLSGQLALTSALPATLVPLVRWGEKTGDLPEALRGASDLFLDRIQLRAILLRSIAPPLVFIVVLAAVGFMIVSLFIPLISLIQGLS